MSKVKTCWRHLLYWLVISSSVNVKKSQVLNVKKSKKIDENMKYWRIKYLPLYSFYLNGLKNLNEIFRRDVTYEKIKNYWKAGNCFFFFFFFPFPFLVFSFIFYFLFFGFFGVFCIFSVLLPNCCLILSVLQILVFYFKTPIFFHDFYCFVICHINH